MDEMNPHMVRTMRRLGPNLALLFAGALVLSSCSPTPLPEAGTAARGVPQWTLMERPDLGRHFGDIEGSFVLLDAGRGRMIVHNPERARTRFLPASTFKIANTLIALEAGAVDGPEALLVRDSLRAPRQDWWPAVWARDHTLRTALAGSVVWYYQELARRIGPQRMQAYLSDFDYGNRDISGGIDQFWLTGSLRISSLEQVEFLRRFYHGELGLSARTTRIARELLILEEMPGSRLSGKTGWAGLDDTDVPQVGWLVGYLEREDEVYFYATNIRIRDAGDAAARHAITRRILVDLGLLAPDSIESATR
jgi:beta-lactamase class D